MTDLTKAATSGTADAPGPGTPPRSIVVALYAAGLQLICAALYAVVAWPLRNQLRSSIVTANNKLKKPKVYCGTPRVKGCLDVNASVHTLQVETAIVTVLVSVALVLILQRVRRGIRSGRTLYMVTSVVGGLVGFAAGPLSLLAAAASGPAIPRVLSTGGAAACVIAVFMMFRPDSQKFFAIKSPSPAAGQQRPGLGGLFSPRPRPQAGSAPKRLGEKPVPGSGVRSTAASRAQARAVKSKTRNDAESIARGAAVARDRAKASKSRRTEI